MSHTYLKSLTPSAQFGQCKAPARYIRVEGNHTLIFCENLHMIKGMIFPNFDDAEKYAQRLAKKLGMKEK